MINHIYYGQIFMFIKDELLYLLIIGHCITYTHEPSYLLNMNVIIHEYTCLEIFLQFIVIQY